MANRGDTSSPAAMTVPRASVLLAALITIALVVCAPTASSYKPPTKVSAAPVTKTTSLRAQSLGIVATLQGMDPVDAYKRYQVSFKKVSLPKADPTRQSIFAANLAKIKQTNSNTKLKYVATCNKFTDATSTERGKLLGLKKPTSGRRSLVHLNAATGEIGNWTVMAARSRSLLQGDASDVPDWSMVVPAVKNQGSCGSCWAFASACVTEAAHFINTNDVISLSEKQLVDCNTANGGCNGGWYDPAFDYIKSKGLTTSASYPYMAQKDTCPTANFPASASKLKSYTALASNNENAMLEALKKAPIAVAVTADDSWYAYGGGVFTSDTCGGDINHAVVIVGAGVDYDTNAPFWLVRNSWGSDWGENGYIRIARGSTGSRGMCNIAMYAYQVMSADVPDNKPTPPPNNDCTTTTYVFKDTDSLSSVAVKYRTTISQILIDNKLTPSSVLVGSRLTITCPVAGGTWSEPYGVWNNEGLVQIPTVRVCPFGEYAVAFYVKPSQWYTADAWTGSTWVGTVTMTCSGGSTHTIDAQPNFNPGWADGTTSQANGFSSIPFRAGWAVDSMFGVGAQTGGEMAFNCPADTVVTGFAGGASPGQYPTGWLANLQFLCRNPFNSQTKLRALRSSSFVRVASGLSCSAYVATATATWFSIAATKRVEIVELMRSNPAINRNVKSGDKLFLPPCVNGVLQGTKLSNAAAAKPLSSSKP